jgi:hypothetical protein
MGVNEDVTIIMVTYYLGDALFKCIDRLIEVTDYPYRLIVAENLSDNSPTIREKLREYVDSGKVDKAYFFNENFLASVTPYIFRKEKKTKYTIITDSDVYITKKDTPCWLTTFVNKLSSEDDLASVAFHSLQHPTLSTASGNHKTKFYIEHRQTFGDDWCYKNIDGHCHHNGHFYTFKTDILKQYPGRLFIDGELIMWLRRRGIKSVRYDKTPVLNMSTITSGLDDEYMSLINIPEVKDYIKLRKIAGPMTQMRLPGDGDYTVYTLEHNNN